MEHFGRKLEDFFPMITPELPIATRGQFASIRPEFLNPKFPKKKKKQTRLSAFSWGPGGFRELQEAGRNHFHLSWYLSDAVVTSYGQNP